MRGAEALALRQDLHVAVHHVGKQRTLVAHLGAARLAAVRDALPVEDQANLRSAGGAGAGAFLDGLVTMETMVDDSLWQSAARYRLGMAMAAHDRPPNAAMQVPVETSSSGNSSSNSFEYECYESDGESAPAASPPVMLPPASAATPETDAAQRPARHQRFSSQDGQRSSTPRSWTPRSSTRTASGRSFARCPSPAGHIDASTDSVRRRMQEEVDMACLVCFTQCSSNQIVSRSQIVFHVFCPKRAVCRRCT